MKFSLTPEEVMHVLLNVVQHPHKDNQFQQSLIAKLKSPLLTSLESLEDQNNINMFHEWEKFESKKLDDLKRENLSVSIKRSDVPIRTARRNK